MSLTKERLMESVCRRYMKRSQARSAIEALFETIPASSFPPRVVEICIEERLPEPTRCSPSQRVVWRYFKKKYTG
jgi:hypothetical protein